MSSSNIENYDLFESSAEPDSGAESVSPSTSAGLEQQRALRFVPRAPAAAPSAALAAPAASPSASASASVSASSSSRRSSLDDANDLEGSCGESRAAGAGETFVCRPRLYLWLKQLRLHKYEQLFAELSFPGMPLRAVCKSNYRN